MDKVKEAIADYGVGIQITFESDPRDELNEQKYGNAARRLLLFGYEYCFPDGGRCCVR
jgi:hypothetical protein